MELIKIFDLVKSRADTVEILYIFLNGSCGWGCSTPHDKDIIVIVKNNILLKGKEYQTIAFRFDEGDIFIQTYEHWTTKSYYYYVENMLLKQHPENLLFGTIKENFNEKEEVFRALYLTYQNGLKQLLRFADNENGNCLKHMYWSLIIYYAALNDGSLDLTKEQWDTIQKCHDGQLPISYRDELKENMEKILIENGFDIKKSKTKN